MVLARKMHICAPAFARKTADRRACAMVRFDLKASTLDFMRFSALPSFTWQRGLITLAAYFGSGVLAMVAAAPGSPVSQLYIAAGVALALTLGWGVSMLLPILLGGMGVVFFSHGLMDSAFPWYIILAQALVSGLGAALQAWLARHLVLGRHRRTSDLPLDHAKAIGRFLLLAGPVASLTNATLSVPSMVWLGIIPPAAAPTAFLHWWAADTMGVMVATPLVLAWVGHPRPLWKTRRKVVGIPMAMATVVLGLTIHHIQRWDQEREAALFERDVGTLKNEVALKLNGYLHALEALHGLYQSSEDVSREEFQKASQFWLANLDGIQALGWSTHVERQQLATFEAAQRRVRPDYKVFDRTDLGRQPIAPKGTEVVAITYIEPLRGNERALGTNILSLTHPRLALARAMETGQSTATPSFLLTQTTGQQNGVVVYRPVLTAKGALQGTLFLTLRLDDAWRVLLKGKPFYMGSCLHEQQGAQRRPVGGHESCAQTFETALTPHRQDIPIEFAGTTWHLQLWAEKPVPIVGRGITAWSLTIAGVGLTAALGAMLLIMSAHTRQVEAAAEEAQKQRLAAEAANRAKSEFLSRMSHELRTPLNAVLGFAQVMDMDGQTPLSESQRQRLNQIQQAGWHLLDMIDDVLDISRMETGTLRLNTESVNVAQAIQQACEQVKPQADNLGIQVIWPQDIPPQWAVAADPIRLRQILQTLLDNGIAYNHSKGSVQITLSRQLSAEGHATIAISVRDTGLGMTEEQLAQLFQPFNRLGREQEVPDGAGVGLAISRHLAMLMNGELEASSKAGSGSTFTLTLPAQDSEESEDRSRAETPATTALIQPSRKHVLYVEDNFANSEVVREALASHPWIRVSISPTIEQGLNTLHNRMEGPRPDLILLDVHLPDASGQEFLRLVKANPDTASIPVMMISADAMPEQIAMAMQAGAADYLTKPVHLPHLLQKLEQLLQPQHG